MAISKSLAVLLTAGLLLGAAACGTTTQSRASSVPTDAAIQPTTGSASPAGHPTATPASSAPSPTGAAITMTSPTPPASGSADWPGGSVGCTQSPGDGRTRSLCVRPGTTVTLTLLPARGYSWAAVVSSAPGVAAVTETRTDPDGTGHAVIHAQATGTAEITSSDSYTPDRFGPPTQLWTLELTVR